MIISTKPNMKILISLIIPVYNRVNLITKTLDSILKNKSKNFEIILVDDGSTDRLSNLIKSEYQNDLKYFKIDNKERGYARNYGAKFAKGDYLNFFDSDDICLPNHIKSAIKIIDDYSRPEVFHLSYNYQSNNQVTKNTYNGIINKKIFNKNICSCNGVFIRADIFKDNKFDENRILSGVEDWDLWLRLATKYKFYSFPDITSTVINHDNRSMNSFNFDKITNRFDYLLKILNDNSHINLHKDEFKQIKAEIFSFKSLYASTDKNLIKFSLIFLFKSLYNNPIKLFTLRSLVTIKNLLIRK